jgi:hypothetical protein
VDRPTVDELFAIGGLDPLVAKLQAGQADADKSEEHRAHQRPDDRHDNKGMRDRADERKVGHVLG